MTGINSLPYAAPIRSSVCQRTEFTKKTMILGRRIFFLPSSSPLSFFRPRTYRKGYYFYSPQSSTVIKSKMAATTILQTRTRFCPPKICLHCRLLGPWLCSYYDTFFSHNWTFTCVILLLLRRHVAIKEIILDPNKKNRTKEAVLKEARYCIVVFKLVCHHLF